MRSVSSLGFRPFLLPLSLLQNINNMNKGTHFIGQPMYGQLLTLLFSVTTRQRQLALFSLLRQLYL